ncbi:MAG: phenylalanine--tRNA ligase subunit alpha [Opitutales bacterium]
MEEQINAIIAEFESKIKTATTSAEISQVSAKFTGAKGSLTALVKTIPSLESVEDKRNAGKLINKAKNIIEEAITKAYTVAENAKMQKALGDKFDITLTNIDAPQGTLHPLTKTVRRICDIFKKIGFTVAQATDIDTEWYCFDALNTPKDHPARDAQDTLFMPANAKFTNINKKEQEFYLLRSHTSTVQIRTMLKESAPVRIIAPGRAFRRDTVDATHSANFNQLECLYIDKDVRLTDLKAVLDYMFKELFGEGAKTRLRPSFFPFTEPSFEVDFMSPDMGKLSNKWIEIMGCGLVDPNVLENVGIDSKVYSGYAFGLGVERVAMLMHSIDDIRHFYANDIRFLKQFSAR